jgi:hypothetical protein
MGYDHFPCSALNRMASRRPCSNLPSEYTDSAKCFRASRIEKVCRFIERMKVSLSDEPVHLVPELHVPAVIPEAPDRAVDFALVQPLHYGFDVHTLMLSASRGPECACPGARDVRTIRSRRTGVYDQCQRPASPRHAVEFANPLAQARMGPVN